jgi:hypothetical protein
MGKNTPKFDQKTKKEYVEKHLFNELRWLLGAATEWSIQEQLKLNKVGYDVWVYALDSASLHARVLFEFFLKQTNDNHYGANEFIGMVLQSNNYTNDWSGPLHSFLMHAQGRSNPVPLRATGTMKDLNKMPVEFAQEILRLWKEFELELIKTKTPTNKILYDLAIERRKKAIQHAACVASSCVAQQHAKEMGRVLQPIFVFS